MKNYIIRLCLLLAVFAGSVNAVAKKTEAKKADFPSAPTAILFNQVFNDKGTYPDLVINKGAAVFRPDGLSVTKANDLVRLHRYYSLAERTVRYHLKFSADAKAVFQSDKGDFKAYIDVPNKRVGMNLNFQREKKAEFLDPTHEYIVEIERYYNKSAIRLIDLFTGEEVEVSATNDSTGGYGVGVVNQGINVGRQYDYYCFGLSEGKELLVKQMTVVAGECNLTLLIYGDSITEPEGYFPADTFDKSWVQLILAKVKGPAMSSGRGGTRIFELLERIKNELPYVKARYVMVTIGTNGGNTEENLSELVEYIISQGSIPILNNIPSNEHNSQVKDNEIIAKVRAKYGIKGCLFDIPTSVNHDGKQVDTSTMWHEDWGTMGTYFHHPNVKGSRLLYLRTLLDVPEIYE